MKRYAYFDVKKIRAIEQLRTMLAPGHTVYTVWRNAAIGKVHQATLDVVLLQDNEPQYISTLVAEALGLNSDRHTGHITGVTWSIDAGPNLVQALGSVLFKEGGYSLKQRWL